MVEKRKASSEEGGTTAKKAKTEPTRTSSRIAQLAVETKTKKADAAKKAASAKKAAPKKTTKKTTTTAKKVATTKKTTTKTATAKKADATNKTTTAKKAPAKKSTTTAAKKTTTAKKAAPKKTTTTKTTTAKAAPKKTTTAKKATTTKTATTVKAAPKKTTTKKTTTAKKAAPKKTTTAKKATEDTKEVAKSTKATAKKETPKKTVPKKAAPKKTAPKKAAAKVAPKKATAKKPATKKGPAAKKATKKASKEETPEETSNEKKTAEEEVADASMEDVTETPKEKKATAKKAAAKKGSAAKKASKKASSEETTEKETPEDKETTEEEVADKSMEDVTETPKEKKATAKKGAAKKGSAAKSANKQDSSEETIEKETPEDKEKEVADKSMEDVTETPKEKQATPNKAEIKEGSAATKADNKASSEETTAKETPEDKETAEVADKSMENVTETPKEKKPPKRKTAAAKEPKPKKQKQDKEAEKEEKAEEKEANKEEKAKGKEKETEKEKVKGKGKEKEKGKTAEFRLPVTFSDNPSDVLTMGSGEVGQLGLQIIRGRKRPATLADLTNKHVLKLEAGGLHNFVIVQKNAADPTDTEVWSWGCNDNKVLGRVTPQAEDPEDDEAERPERIPALADKHIIDITTGEYHTVALGADGTLYLWGSYKEQEGFLGYTKDQKKEQDLPIVYPSTADTKFRQIASGHNHTLALTHDKRVLTWGYDLTAEDKSILLVPREVKIPQLEDYDFIVKVAAGGYCNFAISDDKRVFAWGLNNYGQLGIGTDKNSQSVTEIPNLYDKNIISIAPGMHHTVALGGNGKVYSSGRGTYGQLATGNLDHTETFVEVEFFSKLENGDKVIQIAGVDNHSVAVTQQGKLYAWGFGSRGQIGNATQDTEGSDAITPFLVAGPQVKGRKIYAAGAGGQHTALLASYPAPPKEVSGEK